MEIKEKIQRPQNKSWLAVMIISLVISLLALTLAALSAYSIWRNFNSIGPHKFITTGQVMIKEVKEKTGRRSYRTVNKNVAVFQTEDGQYRYEGEITPIQRTRIQRGSRYSRTYEVFVDRYGSYKVTTLDKAAKNNDNGKTNLIIFSVISAVGMLATYCAFGKWRPKPPPGIVS
ncbi:hypothetical protein FHU10_3920 [Serratia fonticola]|jgi:hypothetical protein|uniref:DUF3592 domain-containing protein n=1 Tax=Serratia fonticola TaxID=47917 RepID=A0A542D1A3_SERFO|nr:hypothetical protein [Serratia fonticola]TQI81176.1 hypothetical protein FHU09_3787 [Serratia fonticola]TQI96800.1 hypothetical protein FHU11_2259 [Serratia fonticola]TVZ71296.1 hypothetical protein FHU10_3920 [Serratia fonticola]